MARKIRDLAPWCKERWQKIFGKSSRRTANEATQEPTNDNSRRHTRVRAGNFRREPLDEDPSRTYCHCNGPFYAPIIACDYSECNTRWFHGLCVRLNEADFRRIEEDIKAGNPIDPNERDEFWHCSPGCCDKHMDMNVTGRPPPDNLHSRTPSPCSHLSITTIAPSEHGSKDSNMVHSAAASAIIKDMDAFKDW